MSGKFVKVKLLKDNFMSPVIGNPYIGKICPLTKSQAKEFVKLGYAEYHVEEPVEKEQKEVLSDLTVKELKEGAARMGLELPEKVKDEKTGKQRNITKDEIVALVTAKLAELAAAEKDGEIVVE